MQLTNIQYDAIMQSINFYREHVKANGLPMSWLAEYEPTADDIVVSLNEVEKKIIDSNIPF